MQQNKDFKFSSIDDELLFRDFDAAPGQENFSPLESVPRMKTDAEIEAEAAA